MKTRLVKISQEKYDYILKHTCLRKELADWKDFFAINEYLNQRKIYLNDRMWRAFVHRYNKEFGERSTFIATSTKGYKMTTKPDEIRKSCFKNIKQGASMIKNAKACLKELGNYNQLKALKDVDADLDDIISSFGD